jgi:hypothetical protein
MEPTPLGPLPEYSDVAFSLENVLIAGPYGSL